MQIDNALTSCRDFLPIWGVVDPVGGTPGDEEDSGDLQLAPGAAPEPPPVALHSALSRVYIIGRTRVTR